MRTLKAGRNVPAIYPTDKGSPFRIPALDLPRPDSVET